ncbi:MAG: Flagellar hook-length control protein FliK, partial [Myxococcaceae bacterium]|nr:Flagellar hook-length control protein FliK [Myxococcaceae bacterium]
AGGAGGGTAGGAGGGTAGGAGGGAPANFRVTATTNGTGSGTVTSSPTGISCPGSCTLVTTAGTMVTLSATAVSGSTFLGWSGGSCSGTGQCTFTVTADVTISAAFALNNPLVVTRPGNGTGTVSSTPGGITCGTDCSEAYPPGTIVTLSAATAVGSTFTGWGGACTGTGTCQVTMNSSLSVTATFTLNQYPLTISKPDNGSGTVTGGAISCGSSCSASINHGATVTLTAAAATGSTFLGWSGGGCSGTGSCVVTVTAATTVIANFRLNQYTLSVSKPGTGAGTVTGTGITCGADCSEVVSHGTVVTLTANVVSGSGSSFSGWNGGGCSGTGNCIVTMTAATTVVAIFTLTGPGGALFFDGVDDLATLATSPLLDTPVTTVEAWVFLNSPTGAAVSMWGAGGNPDKYLLQFTSFLGPQLTGRIVRGGAPGQNTVNAPLQMNTWVHLAMVYDGNNLSLYENGTQTASGSFPGTLGPTQGPMTLGIEEIFFGSATYMSGRMDEVRIWNVARTPAQLNASYNRLLPTNAPGLIAYYRFDEMAGQAVLDSTSNKLDGVLGPTNTPEPSDPSRTFSTAPVIP